MTTILRAASLIDGTGRQSLSDPVIIIEEGRIRGVFSGEEAPVPRGPGVNVLDFSGKAILPGMIDGHVHLVFNPVAREPNEAWTQVVEESEAQLALRALRNAQVALRSGVTTLRDCGDKGFITVEVRDAIRSGVAIGPRLIVSGPPITSTWGHFYHTGYQADGSDEMRRAVRFLIKEGVDFVKIMVTGGNMTRGTNPSTAQYTVEELRVAVDEVHRVGRRVVVHAHGTPGIQHAVKAGVDTIAHCSWQAEMRGRGYEPRLRQELSSGANYLKRRLPIVDYDPGVVEEMIERGINADLTFSGWRRGLVSQEGTTVEEQDSWRARLRELHQYYRFMREAGIKVTVSSDAGMPRTMFEDFALGPVGVVEAGVMTPMEAIVAVTKLPAEAIGLDDEIGTLQPGKHADLIVVDGDPLQDIRSLRRVELVMLGGRPVVSNRAMTSLLAGTGL